MKAFFLSLLVTLAVACGATEDISVSESISAVKAKHTPRLLAEAGVVSVGIGQEADGQAIIIIGVDNKKSLGSLKLPQELDGYPVKVQVIGVVRAQ